MELNLVHRLTGYNINGSNIENVSNILIRWAIVGYLVFAIWFEHIYILGYNIFLFIGIAGVIVVFIEVTMEEKEPKPNKLDYSDYNKEIDEKPPLS
jgi:uncharacterized membrane protein